MKIVTALKLNEKEINACQTVVDILNEIISTDNESTIYKWLYEKSSDLRASDMFAQLDEDHYYAFAMLKNIFKTFAENDLITQ